MAKNPTQNKLLAMDEVPTDVIPWYKSRTIWLQIVAIIFALGAKFDWWPKDLSQEQVVTVVMIVVGALTTVFRWGTTSAVQLRSPTKNQ